MCIGVAFALYGICISALHCIGIGIGTGVALHLRLRLNLLLRLPCVNF